MASGGKDTDISDDDIRRPAVKHKSKKCKKILSSDSSGESSSDVQIICRRRVKPLQSESEEARNQPAVKHKSNKILSSDSSEESSDDSSGESSRQVQIICRRRVKPLQSKKKELLSIASSKITCTEISTDPSDNEQTEKCAICLSKFSGQDIATPEVCDHVFCLECLQEWAKNVNTCPIDRLKFNLILIRHHKEEKIIKTIFVDNSEINYNSESDSNTESQVNYCELCGEDENEGSLLVCCDCHKFYHYGCIIPNLHTSRWGHWQCPNCDSHVLIRDKFLLEAALLTTGRKLQDIHSMPGESRRSNYSTLSHSLQGRTFINREYARRRQRYQRKQFLRNILSTSESSDEELERRTIASRIYQNHVASRSNNRSPLMSTKRRNELYRARNQRLVSSATTAATNTQSIYAADSDEGYSDFRISSPPASENFDVVGSILQSQTLLHGSDVLTLSRGGTILQNSKTTKNQSIINLNSTSPIHNNEDNSNDSSVHKSPIFSGNMSPYINNAVGRQIPLHSTQNNTSKYGETPRQNYTCGSSSAPRERSLSYDECILSRSAIGSGDNERYNEPNSPISQKSFCSTSASDDLKKSLSSNKDTNKSHHSEEEVDIYSDIESVGDEDNSMSDKIEPIKMPYKCEESQLSDTNDVSDSDNELVIDEDVPAEEENDKLKDVQGFKYSKNDCPNPKSDRHETDQEMEDCCPADTENDYPASPFPIKKYDNYHSGNISSKQISCEENVTESLLESTHKNESSSDVEPQESDMEDDENSLDSTRKSFQGCGSTSCSVKSSPKSLTHCENSISNENEFCENSCLGNEIMKPTADDRSNHENNNTNDSVSQMEVEEFNENNSYKSDSFSQVEEPYKHKKYNFCVTSEQIDEQSRVGDLDSNENSRNDGNSNSSFTQFPLNNERIGLECVALSPSKNNSHFSFASSREKANSCGVENCADSYDSNCAYSQAENSTAFDFKCTEKDSKQSEPEECLDSNENSQNEPHSNLSSSKYEQNADGSEAEELADSNENTRTENNSHFGFVSDQQNADGSDMEDLVDSNPVSSKAPVTSSVTTETINISNDETMKSENDEEDCDSFEDASTPCLDENLDGEIENSPVRNVRFESANQEFSRTPDYEYENETFSMKQNHTVDNKHEQLVEVEANKDEVDLGIEDISEAGSEDLDEFPEDTSVDTKEMHTTSIDDGCAQHALEASHKFFSPSHLNQTFEDQEEGEIIEEKPVRDRLSDRKCSKHDRYYDDSTEYGELAPRMSISDLPRIPKIKRNREKDNVPEPLSFETKRSSVLSRVDLDAVDVSWKRLSKHTRERSYRDGRPKDERLLYRERESRNKERKNVDSGRRSEGKNSERRHEEKKNSDKSKSESRSRKSDKNKEIEYDYSERDKRKSHKDHKEKHSKEKHSKDKKHDKARYSKDETKYEREKTKEEVRYERENRYDKEERFERVIYEKNKTKEKEHKNKRKDRKSDGNKSSKDHSREKHKHTHNSESFSDKQREREVRKIDDKLKIVVEQKEKEKSKNKDRKEAKYEKDIHQRKRESGSNLYSEMTSIESKEIFAKGDSIIINVSFNRASSPKDVSSTDGLDIKTAEQKLPVDEFDQNGSLSEDTKIKSKNVSDKNKSALECMPTKRPATPPERPIQVLSVSESYWQGGDDPDGNNSVTSEKSVEGANVEDENDLMESADETGNFSSTSNSTDAHAATTTVKEDEQEVDVKSNAPEENVGNFTEKEKFTPKRRSPRSPSPPSPADNDSYDPCEPTKSPSPPPPIPPPLPSSNPKPPPSPELPPLPPEPEPVDAVPEDTLQIQPEFNIPNAAVSSAPQPVTVETQTPSSLAFTGMLLPPPSFFSSSSNSLPNISSLLPPRTMSFQANNSNVIPPSHMSQVMGGNFLPSQMHGGSTLPPPPNPPNIPHMTSVPPPPPPPSAMALISQVRHPQLNVQPPIPPTSLLQNLSMAHGINIPQLQLPPLPHLPPNLCAALANHQSPLTYTSQNQPTSLPININQQGSRIMLTPNQISLMPNQNMSDTNKPHVMSITQMLSHCQTIPVSSTHKPEEPNKPSTPTEKNEVVDMDVDSPYSPGDCSIDSVNDYSPTGSPLPCTPKTGDIFDTLFTAADVRTSDKRTHDTAVKGERSKSRSSSKSTNETPSKKLKHDHKGDSKVRHSVRMQLEKNKKTRKEQKIAEKISKLDDSQLKILDDLPSSAVEMQVKEKFLKKLNRQERVIEEVKLALKPYYKSRDVNKEEYKDILRRAVPKICHNKSGEINPVKVKSLVECYIKKVKHSRKRGDKRKSKFS